MKTTPAAKTERRQNPVFVAMTRRHATTTTTMRDRRAPRGGSRNKQTDFRSGNY